MIETNEYHLLFEILRKYGDAYYSGRRAGEENLPKLACPYESGGYESGAWIYGWSTAAGHQGQQLTG